MPRRARLAVANVPWHIVQRGHNRTPCFFTAADYRHYLDNLIEYTTRWGCAVHAFVLMTNHVHVLLTPREAHAPSRAMQQVAQRYTQYVNRTYGRSGTVWEGRFRSCLTQDDHYLLACYRYIEMNPVRAGLCAYPVDYGWSSHRANAFGEPDTWLEPHANYLALGRDPDARRKAYRALFEQRLERDRIDAIRSATDGNYVLGNGSFADQIGAMLERRVSQGSPGRPLGRGRRPRSGTATSRQHE